jgi:hypothetical protein
MIKSINIEFDDGTVKELEVGKVIAMNSNQGGKIYLEELNDKKWRLLYTEDIIPDFSKVMGFNVCRK